MNSQDFRALQEAYLDVYGNNATHGGANASRRRRGMQVTDTSLDEEYDLYDIILSHLLDEGYADTEDSALVIMANMSEDWRDSICEELTGERLKRALEIGGPVANRIATANQGQPLETKSGGLVTMRTTVKGPTKRGGGGIRGRIKPDFATHGGGHKTIRRRGMKVRDTSDEL